MLPPRVAHVAVLLPGALFCAEAFALPPCAPKSHVCPLPHLDLGFFDVWNPPLRRLYWPWTFGVWAFRGKFVLQRFHPNRMLWLACRLEVLKMPRPHQVSSKPTQTQSILENTHSLATISHMPTCNCAYRHAHTELHTHDISHNRLSLESIYAWAFSHWVGCFPREKMAH